MFLRRDTKYDFHYKKNENTDWSIFSIKPPNIDGNSNPVILVQNSIVIEHLHLLLLVDNDMETMERGLEPK